MIRNAQFMAHLKAKTLHFGYLSRKIHVQGGDLKVKHYEKPCYTLHTETDTTKLHMGKCSRLLWISSYPKILAQPQSSLSRGQNPTVGRALNLVLMLNNHWQYQNHLKQLTIGKTFKTPD